MLDAYSKGGQMMKAREMLEKMRVAGCTPDIWTYNIMLDTAGKAGSVSEAMEIFEDLKAAGHSPNLVSFSAMINMYGRVGLFTDAQRVWAEMRTAGVVPNATAYCGLINSFSHHGMHKVGLVNLLFMSRSLHFNLQFGPRKRVQVCDQPGLFDNIIVDNVVQPKHLKVYDVASF